MKTEKLTTIMNSIFIVSLMATTVYFGISMIYAPQDRTGQKFYGFIAVEAIFSIAVLIIAWSVAVRWLRRKE